MARAASKIAAETRGKILAAAEARMRAGGFHGFSFREIAADVGIKSASVHHHFPTKEDLAVAVIEGYIARFMGALGDPADPGETPKSLLLRYVDRFRTALLKDRQMCLCGLIASESAGLPDRVAAACTRFFEESLAWLRVVLKRKRPRAGAAAIEAEAIRIVASLQGALLVTRSLGTERAFDAVVRDLAA